MKEEQVRKTLVIRSAIHSELVIRAREERRSTTNLINLILEQWLREAGREGKDE